MIENPRQRLEQACLCLICAEVDEQRLESALRGGVDVVELMDTGQSDAEMLASAARLRPICDRHGAIMLLNNRPQLVLAADADGVHIELPEVDLTQARAAIGPDRLLGASTRSPEQIDAARREPLDYLSVGPVYATPIRPTATPVGTALVTYASRTTKLPFFAVGGIEPHNAGAVAAAGARRIAVVRAIGESPEPERVAAVLRAEIAAPRDFLERYRARTEAQNAAARARLEPLGPGERPGPLLVSVAITALAALVNLVAFAAGVKLQGGRLQSSEVIPFVVVMLLLSVGMWRRSGAAVLLFMALLAIIVILFSLFLIEASNALGVIVPLLFIGGGGYLFWKLVRVLGRIQAPRH